MCLFVSYIDDIGPSPHISEILVFNFVSKMSTFTIMGVFSLLEKFGCMSVDEKANFPLEHELYWSSTTTVVVEIR